MSGRISQSYLCLEVFLSHTCVKERVVGVFLIPVSGGISVVPVSGGISHTCV